MTTSERARGAAILRTNEEWTVDEDMQMIWGTSYIVEAKTPKTEMLLTLQFPLSTKYVESDNVMTDFDDVYFPGK